jgi:hypothetical protein
MQTRIRKSLQLLSASALILSPLAAHAADAAKLFDQKNLAAWCIVPFDSLKRSPAQRAEMLERVGITKVAYDWRAEHVPQFEEEILEYKKHGLEFFAFWGAHEDAFKLFEKYNLHPQIWQSAANAPADADRETQIKKAAEQLLKSVERAKSLGCAFGIYNHGGWGGEPENLVAVCEYLRKHHDAKHVGIVYNQHHGHGHVHRFKEALAAMAPYLICLNLDGMAPDGDKRGMKILPLSEGQQDLELLKIIANSPYSGPIGIIGHTNHDVELRLRDNLDGLKWLLPQIEGKPAAARPPMRVSLLVTPPAAAPSLPAAK